MPDFEELYNPEHKDLDITPEPELESLGDPGANFTLDAWTPGSDGNSFAKGMFQDMQTKFSKPSMENMLEPVSYDPETTQSERYVNNDYFGELGFNPFDDNEEIYGSRQTRMNKLKNAFSGMAELAVEQFKDQALSWGDTFTMFKDTSIKAAFQQLEMEEIFKKQQQFSNENPIFETAADREGIWNFNTLANTLQQSGYAVGAIAEIAAEELALSALTALTFGATSGIQAARTAKLAMNISKVIKRTEELSKSITSASKLRKVYGAIGRALPLGNIVEFGMKAKTLGRIDDIAMAGSGMAKYRTWARGFGAFYRDIRELNVAIAEAKAEAAGSYGDLSEKLSLQFERDNGRKPNDLELKDIQDIAMEAAQTNGVANTAAILMTNKLAMGNALRGFKGMRHLVDDDIMKGITMLSDKQALKTGTKLVEAAENKWLTFRQKMLSNPVKYFQENLAEAGQENIQGMLNDGVQAYYQAKYNKQDRSWSDAMVEAARKQYSVEGAKTFISGFFTGGVLGAGGRVIAGGEKTIQRFSDPTSYKERQGKEAEQRKAFIEGFNEIWNNPLGTSDPNSTAIQSNFASLLKQAAATGDKKFFNDIQNDAAREFILAGIRTGSLDVLVDRLKDYTSQLSPEEFSEAFDMDFTKNSQADIVQQIENFANRAEEIQKIHENLMDNYSNPFNPNLVKDKESPEYQKQALGWFAYQNAIDQMVFMKDTYQRAVVRQNQILQGIQELDGVKDISFSNLFMLSSGQEMVKEMNILREEITSIVDPKLKGEKERRLVALEGYRDTIKDYFTEHERIITELEGAAQEEALSNLDAELKSKVKPQLGSFLNEELSKLSKPDLTEDSLSGAVDRFFDYYKLQNEAKVTLRHINLVSDPLRFNDFLQRHIDAAAKMNAENSPAEPSKEIKSQTVNVYGKDVTFTTGEIYIGTPNDKPDRLWGGKRISIRDNDIVGIMDMDEDGTIHISVNGETGISVPIKELAAMSVEERWRRWEDLSDFHKTFLALRNSALDYRIIMRDNNNQPRYKKNGKIDTRIVRGRIRMSDDRQKIMFVYIDPITGKERSTPFHPKYVVNKMDLRKLPEADQQLLMQYEQFMENARIEQETLLFSLIEETEAKITETERLRDANMREFQALEEELPELQEELKQIAEELENLGKKGKRDYKAALKERLKVLPEMVAKLEARIQKLQQERENLDELLQSMKAAHQIYFEGLEEIDNSGEAFTGGDLKEVEQRGKDLKRDLVTKRFSGDQLTQMIGDTEAEIDLIDERIKYLSEVLQISKKALSRLLQYADVADRVFQAERDGRLKAELYLITQDTDNPYAVELAKDLLKALAVKAGPIERAYTKEAISRYVNAIDELNELSAKRDELAAKAFRLSQAQSQQAELTDLRVRYNFLRTIQSAIAGQRTVVAARAAKQKARSAEETRLAAELVNLQDEAISREPRTYDHEGSKPVFDFVGLFKTAGRHFVDKDDTELNEEDGNAQFFRFAEGVDTKDLHLMVVGKTNDNFGIRNEDANEDDLKVIAVRKVGKEYIPVDINGDTLDEPNSDTIIYRSLHGNEFLLGKSKQAAIDWVKANFVIDKMSDEQIWQQVEKYRKMREDIKSRVAKGEQVYLQVTGKSNGIQAQLPKDSTTGQPQQMNVSERLIEDNPDWTDLRHPDGHKIKMVVVTKRGEAEGVLPGRLVMMKNDGQIFRVFNREMNTAEKDTLIELLKMYSSLFGRKDLTEEQAAEKDKIRTYLADLVYWSLPSNRSAAEDSFTIENGFLVRGTIAVPFTPEDIELERATLTDGLYHNVNNSTLKKDGKFIELRVEDGEIVENEWETYSEFLLSEHEDGTAPVYTNVPIYESPDQSLTPQKKSVYLKFSYGDLTGRMPVAESEVLDESDELVPGTYTLTERTAKGTVNTYDVMIAAGEEGPSVNILNISSKRTDGTTLPAEVLERRRQTIEEYMNGDDYQAAFKEAGSTISLERTASGFIPISLEDMGDGSFTVIERTPNGNIIYYHFDIVDGEVGELTSESATQDPTKRIGRTKKFAETIANWDFEGFENSDFVFLRKNASAPDTIPFETDIEDEAPIEVAPKRGAKVKETKDPKQAASDVINALEGNFASREEDTETDRTSIATGSYRDSDLPTDADDPAPFDTDETGDDEMSKLLGGFRLALGDVENTEDFEEMAAWFKKNLPQFPIHKSAELIHKKAWGAFMNGAVYLYENAEAGTGYHEAFEAVWYAFLSNADQQNMIDEFRARTGEFTNPFTNETKSYSAATAYDVKEMLAEEFRTYMLDREAGKPEPTGVMARIMKFFTELWNSIKSFVGLSTPQKEELDSYINDIYKKIDSGAFATAVPIRELEKSGTNYRLRIPGTSQEITNYAVEGLASIFFLYLYSKGNNIDTVLQGKDAAKVYRELMQDTFSMFYKRLYRDFNEMLDKEKLKQGGEITKEEKDALYMAYREANPGIQQLEHLSGQENQKILYDNLKRYLEKYGMRFDELSRDEKMEAVKAREDGKNPLGIMESISVDPRKLATANVNVLLASLTEDYYDKNGKVGAYQNPLNMPRLVDFNKVRVTLLNELSGSLSIIRDDQRIDNIQHMFERLDNKYMETDGTYKPGYVWIQRLKDRLKVGKTLEEMTEDDIRMIVGFEESFTTNQLKPLKLIVDDDNMYDTDPVMETNKTRIRTRWENNVKDRITPGKVEAVKMIYADAVSGDIMINYNRSSRSEMSKFRKIDNVNDLEGFRNMLDKLALLGIQFTEPADRMFYRKNAKGEPYPQVIKNAYTSFVHVFEKQLVDKYSDLYGNQIANGPLNTLLELEFAAGSEDMVLSHLNAEGKQQFSVVIPSNIAYILNSLADSETQAQFVANNPQFGYVDNNGTVQLNPYQSRSLILKLDGLIFDKNGKKKSDIDYQLISGMAQAAEAFGENTSDLTYPDRVINEIHYLLKNIHFTIINSDKGSEFALGLAKPFVDFNDTRVLRTSKPVMNIYLDQLEDEMDAAYMDLANPSRVQYYTENVLKLGHYRNILGKNLAAKFAKDVLGAKVDWTKNRSDFTVTRPDIAISESTYQKRKEKFLKDVEITNRIRDYIVNLSEGTLQSFIDLDIIQRHEDEEGIYYSSAAISPEQVQNLFGEKKNMKDLSDADVRALVNFMVVNKEIAVTEQHKLIYGHPTQYKDLAKRSNGATSTKQNIVDNQMVIEWMDTNMKRMDGKVRSAQEHQTFNNITYKDVNVASNNYEQIATQIYESMVADLGPASRAQIEETVGARFDTKGKLKELILDSRGRATGLISKYMDMTEADAQGWIMGDMYRDMLFLSAKWNKEQQAQWDYEMAYEILARSNKPQRDRAWKEYSAEQIAWANEKVKVNPGAILQPLKPQYFGYADTPGLMHTVFLKHSVQPKFYRHVEGTQMEQLYLQAQENGVDVINFESGEKVGNVYDETGKFTSLYDTAGRFSGKMPPMQKLFTRFYGVQVEVPNVLKDHVVRGTQVTKLVISNFIVNGVGITPNAEKMVADYMDTVSQLVELGKAELMKELGLSYDPETGYTADDVTKLVTILQKEAEVRDLPDNIISAIAAIELEDGRTVLKYRFDSLANREKIEQILSSIVDSRVISEKMHGKPAVQVASTMYEKNPRNYTYLKNGKYEQLTEEALGSITEDEAKTIKMVSNDLKFYRLENGRIAAMEVYLPWFFQGINPEELGLKKGPGGVWVAASGKLDQRLLEAIGFRIPTQGMNSIESLVIKGFLDPSGGDQVVVPSEIVGKSGSDFDIDKLNIYLPNYYIDHKNFGSDEFRAFMRADMIKRGMQQEDATNVMNALAEEDFAAINSSTYTEYGKEEKGARTHLGELGHISDVTLLAFIKTSIQTYNKLYTGNKRLVYVEPDNGHKEALQNRLIRQMKDLVETPENFRQLITPNSVDTMKSLADEIRELKGLEDAEADMTKLRQLIPMAETRERYLTSKRMVGIGALQITLHAMAQVAGLELTGNFDSKRLFYLYAANQKAYYAKFGKDLTAAQRREQLRNTPIWIRLPHNQKDGKLYLYAKTDQAGMWISELHSEALSGFVDGAKDPFVFDLNLNMDTASTWLYLQKLGVSVRDIAYLHTQPIIEDYFANFARNKSLIKAATGEKLSAQKLLLKSAAPYYREFLNGKDIFEETERLMEQAQQAADNNDKKTAKELYAIRRDMIAKFTEDIREARTKKVTTASMKAAIKSGGKNMSKDMAMQQLTLLVDYLEYKQQAGQLSSFVRGISYDNSRTRTLVENRIQEARWNKTVQQKFIANPEKMLENTFLGTMKEQKEDIFNMFQDFFVALHPKALPAFNRVIERINDDDSFMSSDKQADMLNKYQNFLLSFLLHTTAFKDTNDVEHKLNKRYNLLFGQRSLANQLAALQRTTDPVIKNNPVVKELFAVFANNVKDTNNIRLFRRNLDTYDIDVLTDALTNLWVHARETRNNGLEKFVQNLSVLAIVQSGLMQNRMSINRIMPTQVYSDLVNSIFETFMENETNPNLEKFVYKQFHQNNWWNRDIVPIVKASYIRKRQNNGNIVGIDGTDDTAKSDYILRYIVRPGVNIEQLQKEGRGNEAFEPTLYERIKVIDIDGDDITEDGTFVYYRRINKLGARQNFTEVYDDDNKKSMVESNGYFDESSIEDAVKKIAYRIADQNQDDEDPDDDNGTSAVGGPTYEGRIIEGDIWAQKGTPIIPTNLGGVHGAGLANQANKRGIITYKQDGDFGVRSNSKQAVITFPVKQTWDKKVDMALLTDSAKKLTAMANANPKGTYLLPLVGLGHGEGDPKAILPLIRTILDKAPNVKLVLATAKTDRGKAGTVRTDNSQEIVPQVRAYFGLSKKNPGETSTEAKAVIAKKEKESEKCAGKAKPKLDDI